MFNKYINENGIQKKSYKVIVCMGRESENRERIKPQADGEVTSLIREQFRIRNGPGGPRFWVFQESSNAAKTKRKEDCKNQRLL